ncbi:MAG: ADP-glyceromanno-heptose 6-epimerase [Betaproteobacteria bacterium]|nr:ADP-glyceromanno-heptose 6-epimerase [Betaproteobacteria bacterium]MDE2124084.1 ADP-glyceromanno-heptose 6-epimerase [Betaproteobacteria bacterium]MDE2186312.1 ADP-glyceromanno-heptose 6-epimerase [Betaproteobacteria bacterium]MDE2323858.1 ADP-glyceromanno-heptose 6-epimerase [Betaproteobacteria bacterium]
MTQHIIVTGAAGFIGSNIVRGLNARGITDIIAVDNLTQADKFHNLVDLRISDYIDKTAFYEAFAQGRFGHVDAVFHEGACSDTMEHDGRYMLDNNYAASKRLLDTCLAQGIRLLYASSAATYGGSASFVEQPRFERPLNVYGYSKLLFDQVVRRALPAARSQVAGFRYFNVYGPGEQHKGRMASVAFHHVNQYRSDGRVKLFGSYGGYGPGAQMRDFVYIDDVVAVNLWFFDNPQHSGVFNLGSGRAQPFNDVAHAVINSMRAAHDLQALSLVEMVGDKLVEYIDFPAALVGKYQCHTEADLQNLRSTGCHHTFTDVATGVGQYVRHLLQQRPH